MIGIFILIHSTWADGPAGRLPETEEVSSIGWRAVHSQFQGANHAAWCPLFDK